MLRPRKPTKILPLKLGAKKPKLHSPLHITDDEPNENRLQLMKYEEFKFNWDKLPAEIKNYIIEYFDSKTALNFAQTNWDAYNRTCRLYDENKLKTMVVNSLCVKIGKEHIILECVTHSTTNDPSHRASNKLETCWRCLRKCPHLDEYFRRFCPNCKIECSKVTLTSLPLVLSFITVLDAVAVGNIKYAKGPDGKMSEMVAILEKHFPGDIFDRVAKIVMHHYPKLDGCEPTSISNEDDLSLGENPHHSRRHTEKLWTSTQHVFGRGCFDDPELVFYTKFRSTQFSNSTSFPDITWVPEHVEEKEIVVKM